MSEDQSFDVYAVVELFGHQVIAGRVTERMISGQGFIQVDVPAVDGQAEFSKLYGPGAIYAITPTTKAVVEAYVRRRVAAPIKPYELEMPRLPEQSDLDFGDDEDQF